MGRPDTAVVTGGTGFTGAHLVRALLHDGVRVRVLARSAVRARTMLPPTVDVVEGDITDPAAVAAAVCGQRVVYHLATSFRQANIPDQRHWEIHVLGTRLLLEASAAAGIDRFVHCSTVGVLSHIATPPADESWEHQPGDIYQATKSEAEKLALAYHATHGLPVSVAWPTPIYGPGDLRLLKMFRLIAARRFVMLGSGDVFFHMVHVTDLVRGLRLLAERPEAVGRVFILGGEEYRTLNEVAGLIAAAVGAPPPRVRLPARPFQLAGVLCERICIPFGIEPPIYRRRVDFFTKSRAFRIDRAKRLLGYTPRIDLETGIRETAEWYRQEGLLP